MIDKNCEVITVEEIQKKIYILQVKSRNIANAAKPGQFCNIKVSDSYSPLLRRPFSICDVKNDVITFQFALVGEGTEILSKKRQGDLLDINGPLGNGFDYSGDFKNAVIVAGGIGTAPFPFLTGQLKDKNIITLVGSKTKTDVIKYKLKNVSVATDDGSEGFNGNVVKLLESVAGKYKKDETKIFACGPNPMLRALSKYTIANGYNCEISTESNMACGFGICQGCNIHSAVDENKFLLVCKDGPVFNAEDVLL
jgi:dihydroorotate dehydrogenase electron transfer subunit